MNAFSALLRRVLDLWIALTRSLRRAPQVPPALVAAPPPPPAAAAPAPAAAAPVALTPAPAARVPAAPPPPPPAPAARAAAPAPAVEPVAVRSDMSQSAVMVDIEGPPASASAIAAVAVPAVRADAPAPVTVRQFFARVAAAGPGGLTVDFANWQNAKVERFFMAMGSPERVLRRGPALAEEVALDRAFDGFQWD